jgi:hypothetical protein
MWKIADENTCTKQIVNPQLIEKGLTHFTVKKVSTPTYQYYNLYVTSTEGWETEIASGIESASRARELTLEFEEDWERDITQWYFFKMLLLTLLVIALICGLTLSPNL